MGRRAGWHAGSVVAALATASCAYPDFPAREDGAADSTLDAGDSTAVDAAIVDGRLDAADTTVADANDSSAGDSARPDTVAEEGSVDAHLDTTPDVPADACSDVGACVPGATRSVSCGLCGAETDTCSPGCTWTAGACSSEGVCTPGSTSSDATGCTGILVKSRVCRPDCLWAGYSVCDIPYGWTAIAPAGIIGGRVPGSSTWTGSEMVVSGGRNAVTILKDGAAYNPSTNTWRRIADAPAPGSQSGAVWTGSALLVVFGPNLWSYSPASDGWTSLGPTPFTDGRSDPNSIWSPATGEAIFWSGSGVATATDGWVYKPSAGTWRVMTAGPISARWHVDRAYSGGRALFFGGFLWDGSGPVLDGATYDPVTDTWVALTSASKGGDYTFGGAADVLVPSERAAFWNGDEGFLTDPLTNTSVSIPPLPATITLSTAPQYVWTSDRWLFDWSPYYAEGAYFDVGSSTWSLLQTAGAPSKRKSPAMVNENGTLVVWSGKEVATGAYPDDGAILRPF